jgi:hypothetical protein
VNMRRRVWGGGGSSAREPICHGDVNIAVRRREFFFDFAAIADNFAIDEDGFCIHKAANAPAGDRHLVDQLLFRGDGRETENSEERDG